MQTPAPRRPLVLAIASLTVFAVAGPLVAAAAWWARHRLVDLGDIAALLVFAALATTPLVVGVLLLRVGSRARRVAAALATRGVPSWGYVRNVTYEHSEITATDQPDRHVYAVELDVVPAGERAGGYRTPASSPSQRWTAQVTIDARWAPELVTGAYCAVRVDPTEVRLPPLVEAIRTVDGRLLELVEGEVVLRATER